MIWRWLRSPVLHFVLIGGALFGASLLRAPWARLPSRDVRAPVIITAERVRLLQSEFVQRWGVTPTSAQLQSLIDQRIEDEILYREARRLALGFEDPSVRRRLIEKMRLVSDRPERSRDVLYREALALGLDDDAVIRGLLTTKMRLFLEQDAADRPLQEQDLLDYLERHRERFMQPAEVTFSHVFLSATTHGRHLEKDAQTALARLRSESPGSAATTALSDPFPLGSQCRAYSQPRVESRFGKRFAEQVFRLPLGRWSGPIPSPYGLHLIWVHETLTERVPPLDAVRETIARTLVAERATARLARGLARLRDLYDVRVEGDARGLPVSVLATRP